MPKHGEVREDGKVYWGTKGNGYEEWTTVERFNKRKQQRRERTQRIKKSRRRWLNIYKKAKGCEICGYNEHPSALEFDHLPQHKKHEAISRMVDYNLKRLFKEIRKCRILCVYCHRIHTDEQRRLTKSGT